MPTDTDNNEINCVGGKMDIFVSKITEDNDDYSGLLKNTCNIKKSIRKGAVINYKYNKEESLLVIDGGDISASITGFAGYFKNEYFTEDWIEEQPLVECLHDKMKNIVAKTCIKYSEKNYLFIHWGGSGREKYSTRLRNAANQSDDFPFEIIDFSSTDNITYKTLKDKTIYEVLKGKESNSRNIQDAIKLLIDQSKIYSRKIYELMESIYIRGFGNYEESKILTLSDKDIAKEAKWLTKNSKEVLTSLQSKEIEAVKGKITELYNQTNNFENFITLKNDEKSIEITNLKAFREKINELLNILPFPIYSRDL